MFGTQETPSLLDGKVKLMIHLLSPANRPMQKTQDLQSFWQNTYSEVKKELRGKYKKHYGPNDPYSAIATSKTKKRISQPICLLSVPAQYFNRRYKRSGHLWQDRYQSKFITSGEYLYTLVYYIEYNPVEAGLAQEILPLGCKT